jgi:hypothetical protein
MAPAAVAPGMGRGRAAEALAVVRVNSSRFSRGFLQLLPPKTRAAQSTAKGFGAKPATRRKGKEVNDGLQVDDGDCGDAARDDGNSPPCLARSAKGQVKDIIPAEGDPTDVATTKVLVRIYH